jgi:hypothetical protein
MSHKGMKFTHLHHDGLARGVQRQVQHGDGAEGAAAAAENVRHSPAFTIL